MPRAKPKHTLTPKQERFALEWLVDFNATQAAIRAGYSPRTANEQGAALLAKPSIHALVQRKRQQLMHRTELTAERIIEEYRRIALADARSVMSWGPGGVLIKRSEDLTDEEAAAISEVSEVPTKEGTVFRVKFHSKTEALKALSQHLGLFDGHQGDGLAANVTTINNTLVVAASVADLATVARILQEAGVFALPSGTPAPIVEGEVRDVTPGVNGNGTNGNSHA